MYTSSTILKPQLRVVVESPFQEDVDQKVYEYLEKIKIGKVIAFSGGAEENTISEIEVVIEEALTVLRGQPIAILTGGTIWGIPKIAIRKARELGFFTIGVHPKRAKKYLLEEGWLDCKIRVDSSFGESNWGDETSVFVKLLHGMIVLGGGAGTLIEVAQTLKINEFFLKYVPDLCKYIVPISGTGGVADLVYDLPGKSEVIKTCLPEKKIYTGKEAAEFLLGKLHL